MMESAQMIVVERIQASYVFAKNAVLRVFKQEITPEALTASIAVGFTMGICPLIGVTFVLVTIVGILFRRLNMAAMQLVNAVTTPIEMAMLIPYLRLGEFLIGSDEPLALTPELISQSLSVSFFETIAKFGNGLMIATGAWLVTLPFVFAFLYFAMLIPVSYLLAKQQHRII